MGVAGMSSLDSAHAICFFAAESVIVLPSGHVLRQAFTFLKLAAQSDVDFL